MTKVHHQTIESQIADLDMQYNAVRIKARASAQAYADSLDERRILQERIAKLRDDADRMKVAAAYHSRSITVEPAVSNLRFACYVGCVLAVAAGFVYLFVRSI